MKLCTVGLLLRSHLRVRFFSNHTQLLFLFCWMFQNLGCCKGIAEIQNRLDSLYNCQPSSIFMVLFWDAYSSEMPVTSTTVPSFFRTDAQCILCSITYLEKTENCLCFILFYFIVCFLATYRYMSTSCFVYFGFCIGRRLFRQTIFFCLCLHCLRNN